MSDRVTEVFMKKKICITAAAVLGVFVLGFAALVTYLTVRNISRMIRSV